MTWPANTPPFSPHPSTTSDGSTVTDTSTSDLGLLAGLVGKWSGSGFNVIWTPSQVSATGSDRFLQLANTLDSFEFIALDGSVPNRGLNQPDLFMSGIRYSENISSNGKALHFEDGIWLAVPATSSPAVPQSVARMASIPHGTSINAQGTAAQNSGGPSFTAAPITPFTIGQPQALQEMTEQTLSNATTFRTPNAESLGFTQAILNDVNQALVTAAPANVMSTTTISVSTSMPGAPGGGSTNTAFLTGNANASTVNATIWLQSLSGDAQPSVMQYSQTVLLDFNGLSWPHVTVATLQRQPTSPAQ